MKASRQLSQRSARQLASEEVSPELRLRTERTIKELKELVDWPDLTAKVWRHYWESRNGEKLVVGNWPYKQIVAAISNAK